MYRDPWKKKSDSGLRTLSKIGSAMVKAHKQYQREQKRQAREAERRLAAYNRRVAQNERERIRQIKQQEVAMRRAERERAKAEREREKALKLQQKMQEQQRFEDEVSDIEDSNFLWTNVHSFIDDVVSLDDVKDSLAKCDYEQQNNVKDGLFKKEYPSNTAARQQAQKEADSKYNVESAQRQFTLAREEYDKLRFDEVEPTVESVTEELASEAKDNIKAFFPWKQKRLRNEFVSENLEGRFSSQHSAWQQKKDAFDTESSRLLSIANDKQQKVDDMRKSKSSYMLSRMKELFDKEVKDWEQERDEFYDGLRQTFQNVIDGDKDYVITAISSIFPDDELPMEYFVDSVYDEANGKVYVDLDLPEIEDIPDQKITLTSTGKKSIRMKSQTDLRTDYVNGILGLAMQVASSIFNVSLKINEIEIMGYTQRAEANSAIATDQYVFVINFDRETFSKIAFNRLSSVQILDFFQHHINLSKSYVLKEIDLTTAFDKMEEFTVADYDSFIKSLPPEGKKPANSKPSGTTTTKSSTPSQSSYSSASSSATSSNIDDAPIETFEKSSKFLSEIYGFIDRLSRDRNINKHADNLNGVHINLTAGGFTGDGNTDTYRGKLFFCAVIDLYRCLDKMKISMLSLTSSNYPLALFILKIYGNLNLQYYSINQGEGVYKSFINMIRPTDTAIPVPSHMFLIAEVLSDYERDMSWYRQYLSLIGRFIEIVRGSVQSSLLRKKFIDDFIQQLKMKGIDVK